MKWKDKDIEPITGIEYDGRRDLKLKFLARDPHCHWCGREVRDYGARVKGMPVYKDEATVDHVVSRFIRKKGEVSPKVLACHECNQRRSHEEERIYGEKHRSKLLTEVEKEFRMS